MLDPHQIEDLRQTLLAKQDELQGLVDQTKADRSAVELDQAKVGRLSRMDALQMQAMAQAADRRRALELQKIKSALDRIDSGDGHTFAEKISSCSFIFFATRCFMNSFLL